ncbi:MAG: FprA family A-type flavoprotein [Clostridiales Family XIII bacterium]|jgi:flavorubredoxin|nr:FprA family A-type flavoprotein [Clostridiales Family XIII bacterium]
MLTKKLKEDFYWVGNLDPDLRVFDIVMYTEFGTTYNSYILKGSEKTVLFEAAKLKCYDEYIKKLSEVVPLEEIDYLVVSHTEPDHSGTIEKMLEVNPDIEIIGSMGAQNFLKEIINRTDFKFRVVKQGDELSLGNKTLQFILAPNLHWPDTIFTYVPEDKILVTCDAFGSHYSDENITDDNLANRENYLKAALYYFDNIIGPFKGDMMNALKKIEDLDVEILAVGHGPVVTTYAREIIELNREWATPDKPHDKKTIVIPYVSAYGYTKALADEIVKGIKDADDINVKLYDMVYADFNEVMNAITLSDGFLLGTPTIVGEALPPIWKIAAELNSKVHGGKFASAFGSYGWSGEGVPHIMGRLSQLKLTLFGDGLRVRFKPSESQAQEAYDFGYGFGASVRDGKIHD